MRFDEYPYGSIAAIYDALAAFYSRGRIAASKHIQGDWIERGDRVLYAGVGRGIDALAAARAGARVTAVDLAPAMLGRLAKRLEREGLEAELIRGDVSRLERDERYDVVVANYFLNLFEVERAGEMLGHLGSLVRPGGRLLLTDFARPSGGAISRAVVAAYYGLANRIAWLFGFCALHPILDYGPLLDAIGFRIETERRFPVLLGDDPAFVSIEARPRDPIDVPIDGSPRDPAHADRSGGR